MASGVSTVECLNESILICMALVYTAITSIVWTDSKTPMTLTRSETSVRYVASVTE
jgi:hypothetical protein